ncbi:MAG: NACHT domain-containing protein [Leptolyngbya sp. SIOISBB]|nr:NACHT domain-containing protein [Leptolyngbya sp. SIOISBB]
MNTQADRVKLLKAFKSKLNKRLADVLCSEQVMAFRGEDRPQAVGRVQREFPTPESVPAAAPTFMTQLQSLSPMRLFKRPQQQTIELPNSEHLMDVLMQEDIAGRLLILGVPGSGKTTALLELARELVTATEVDETAPMPIIFELSNWKQDRQPIDEWLVAQLKEEYNLPPKVGRHWIATHQILPLLDGLDELDETRLPKCVEKLNDWLPEEAPERQAVVCCRTTEFRQEEVKLTEFNGAVELQPLSNGQIQHYLNEIDQPSLWTNIIAPSAQLSNLARTPLMLTVMVVALANRSAQTAAELFEAYIEEHFARYEGRYGTLPYSRRDTRHYLEQLATQLKAQKQTFLLEAMQPYDWLSTTAQKLAYRLMVGLISGLIFGLIFVLGSGLTGGQISELIFVLIVWLICGSIFGLMGGLDKLKPLEILQFSRFALKKFFQTFFYRLISGLIYGLMVGLVLGLMFWPMVAPNLGLLPGLVGGLMAGLILGLIFGLIFGLMFGLVDGLVGGLKRNVTIRTRPNQDILASAKAAFVMLVVGVFLLVVLNVGLNTVWPANAPLNPILIAPLISTSMFLAVSIPLFSMGGVACTQHLVLRLVLWRSGAIPWNYAKFLKYTSELRLTRQTGGEFRFFHDMLREHLAQSSPFHEI